MKHYNPSPQHWTVLESAARGNVYCDTHNIVDGFTNVHGIALDLIDLGLLDRDLSKPHYRPTTLGEQALCLRGEGRQVVFEFDGHAWNLTNPKGED